MAVDTEQYLPMVLPAKRGDFFASNKEFMKRLIKNDNRAFNFIDLDINPNPNSKPVFVFYARKAFLDPEATEYGARLSLSEHDLGRLDIAGYDAFTAKVLKKGYSDPNLGDNGTMTGLGVATAAGIISTIFSALAVGPYSFLVGGGTFSFVTALFYKINKDQSNDANKLLDDLQTEGSDGHKLSWEQKVLAEELVAQAIDCGYDSKEYKRRLEEHDYSSISKAKR